MGFDSALAGPLASGAARLGVSAQDEARLQKAFVDHYAGIWRFLRRLGVPPDRVDDAAQHAFLVALEALPRIVPGCERAFLYSTGGPDRARPPPEQGARGPDRRGGSRLVAAPFAPTS